MRVSVTDLDQLLWYRRIEDMTLDEIRARLLREEEPNRKMLMGKAWHSILEDPPHEIEVIKRDDFSFMVECDAEIELPQLREIKAEKVYVVDGFEVTLVGRVDGISGNVVTDHKLTARPDPEGYQSSFQWKAYLDIFGADVFEYILYHALDKKKYIIIKDISPFRMYRYPGMVDDLMVGLRDYVQFVREYVPEIVERAA